MTLRLCLVLLVTSWGEFVVHGQRDVLTNHWAVRITGGPLHADRVAAKYGYRNLGQVSVGIKLYDSIIHSLSFLLC